MNWGKEFNRFSSEFVMVCLQRGTEQLSVDHLSQTWLCLYKSREEKDLSDVQTFFLNIFKDFQTSAAKDYTFIMLKV